MLMKEPELDLEHALKFVAINLEIRRLLTTAFGGWAEWSNEVAEIINQMEELLKHTPDEYAATEWQLMIAGLRVLASQINCEKIAESGKGNLTEESTKCKVLQTKLDRLLSSNNVKLLAGQYEVNELHRFLSSIPLPTLYWHSKELDFPYRNANKELENSPNPLLRIIVFLGCAPVASPQLLKPNVLYPLVLRIRGFVWLKEAKRLRLDFITTCPKSEYSISDFVLELPCVENNEYQSELTGQISFNSGQSSWLDDLVFKISAAFEMPDDSFQQIPVIGHNELRLKVVNEYPIKTGTQPLDQHVTELVEKLCKEHPKVLDELPDLLPMLEALNRLRATYAQEAIWKGQNNVPESDFQQTVTRDLRLILGQDVQEHPSQAGGNTDIRYRGVIVELKVEKKNGNRDHIAKKYTEQTVQYAGVEGRQISILLVLDLTEKDKPSGDIREDIFLKDVETHGGIDTDKKFPSKTFIFVINGNMKKPSDYSR